VFGSPWDVDVVSAFDKKLHLIAVRQDKAKDSLAFHDVTDLIVVMGMDGPELVLESPKSGKVRIENHEILGLVAQSLPEVLESRKKGMENFFMFRGVESGLSQKIFKVCVPGNWPGFERDSDGSEKGGDQRQLF
jgi:hypothetical protein